MNYKVIYMPHPAENGKWFDTEEDAWDYIAILGCNGKPCEMCQAEYEVFSRQELNELLYGGLPE